MWICYHADGMSLKEYHNTDVESDAKSKIEKIRAFLQGEFKKTTGKALSLSEVSEEPFRLRLEYISRVRTALYAAKCYRVSGLETTPIAEESDESRLDDKFKKFLDQGGWGQKPKNQSAAARKNSETPFDPTRL